VKITPIGHPTWAPVDFHLFSAPIGTAADGYAEFSNTQVALLPPPKHVVNSQLGGPGPGAPHLPPYDSELAQGVAALGFHEGTRFSMKEFSNGMGIYLVWMNVPAPGTIGSSPDFLSGPIIGNSLFPISNAGKTFHNGKEWNPNLGTFDVLALNQLNPPFNVDGASHFPIFYAENADFGPATNGSYEFHITSTDISGNGWKIEAHFAVAP
jgi:hypothetical protein